MYIFLSLTNLLEYFSNFTWAEKALMIALFAVCFLFQIIMLQTGGGRWRKALAVICVGMMVLSELGLQGLRLAAGFITGETALFTFSILITLLHDLWAALLGILLSWSIYFVTKKLHI